MGTAALSEKAREARMPAPGSKRAYQWVISGGGCEGRCQVGFGGGNSRESMIKKSRRARVILIRFCAPIAREKLSLAPIWTRHDVGGVNIGERGRDAGGEL